MMKRNLFFFCALAAQIVLVSCGDSSVSSEENEGGDLPYLSMEIDISSDIAGSSAAPGGNTGNDSTSSVGNTSAGGSSSSPTTISWEAVISSSADQGMSSSDTSSAGTSSGEEVSSSSASEAPNTVECGLAGTFRDVRDGKTYGYATIGGKIWMAQNLDYAADGSMCYGNNAANCEQYGRLYLQSNASAACPEGWTVPTRDEGDVLIGNGAQALLASGTNTTGFSALLGGSSNGNMGKYGIYWISQTDFDIRLASNEAVILQAAEGEYAALRCVHDTIYDGICVPGAENPQTGGMSSETQTTSSSQEQSSSSSEQIPETHAPSVSIQWSLIRVTINDLVGFGIRNLQDAAGVNDIVSYDWNFGDGQTIHKTDGSGLKHAWTTAGTYTVTLRVTDSNGDYAEDALTMTILQGAPEVDAGADVVCHNNTACVFSGTANDPNTGSQEGSGSIVKYLWDYESDGVFDDSSATNSFSHAYADTSATAAYTAKFCARDDDDNEVCDTTHVSVTNRAPRLTGFIQSSGAIWHVFRTDSLRFSDPDGNLQPIFYWDMDEDGVFETIRQATDTVIFTFPSEHSLRHIAVYGKDRWGASSDTARAMFGEGPQLLDIRDGNTYKTVGIGKQMWMAENLNHATAGSWCYNDSANYCENYGRLYSWGAAIDSVTTWCGYGYVCRATAGRVQGVCPDGWHLPDSTEWETLISAAGGRNAAGWTLKSYYSSLTSGWNNGWNGNDGVFFAALPSGYYYNHNFSSIGNSAHFWSSSEYDFGHVYSMMLRASTENAEMPMEDKRYGLSVRCVKDD